MSLRKSGLSRRDFLKNGAYAAAAMGMLPGAKKAPKVQEPVAEPKAGPKVDPSKILNYHPDMRYRRLGNTDIYLSVISLGGIGIDKSVMMYGIDKGINCLHTSNRYSGGNSIKMLGELLKTKRDRVYVALKDTFDNIDDDLQILNTDHVDFVMFNRHSESAVLDPGVFEDFAKYKKEGKALYAGLTSHDNVKACVAAAIQCGKYALIQPTLNRNAFDSMQPELQMAAEKGVGIMGMKTAQGFRDLDLELANLKKLVANPGVVTVSRVLKSFEQMDAYIKTVKETLSAAEDMSLYRYARLNRSNLCMMCGTCEAECPANVRISSVLRSKYYYADQLGEMDMAAETYREAMGGRSLPPSCSSCGKCESACPNGIPVRERLAGASNFFEGRSA
jgi:predicted aldo/keto reductase-like oxidoreductase